MHLSSYVLFFTATLHALTAGSDSRQAVFVLACGATFAVVLFLTLVRLFAPHPRSARAPARRS